MSTGKNIAFVNQPFSPLTVPVNGDSIGIWNYQVARELAGKHNVTLYSMQPGDLPEQEEHEGITHIRIPVAADLKINKLLRIPAKLKLKTKPWFARNLCYANYIKSVSQDIQKRKCEIIHLHNLGQFAGHVRHKNPDTQIFLHMHCEWLSQLPARITRSWMQAVDVACGCSRYISERIRTALPDSHWKVETVYNGVNWNNFSKTKISQSMDDTIRILFVGRISPEKGVHTLIKAFNLLCDKKEKIYLTLVGPQIAMRREFLISLSKDPLVASLGRFYTNDYQSHIESLVSNNARERIHFTGACPYAGISAYYHNADILVLPSVSEAFGMPAAEAMAVGLPVVAAKTGGLPEIVDHKRTGLIVKPENPDVLADAMKVLIHSHELRQVYASAGKQKAGERFQWKSIAKSIEEIYYKTGI